MMVILVLLVNCGGWLLAGVVWTMHMRCGLHQYHVVLYGATGVQGTTPVLVYDHEEEAATSDMTTAEEQDENDWLLCFGGGRRSAADNASLQVVNLNW